MADCNPIPHNNHPPFHELCCPQIWRGRDGRTQVSRYLMSIVSILTLGEIFATAHNHSYTWSTTIAGQGQATTCSSYE